jgi:hypothetical protein
MDVLVWAAVSLLFAPCWPWSPLGSKRATVGMTRHETFVRELIRGSNVHPERTKETKREVPSDPGPERHGLLARLPVEVHLSRRYHDGHARFTPHSPHASSAASVAAGSALSRYTLRR